ncbi:DUF2059 domain-containing protein [Massilia sp. 9096]|uniref:DUF2059 domain-containing protein n=1 Tax=Massilia sp. 9096 TaxID=1500894 RepID=UPI000B02BBAA|nr:DUF2059 domain-containing protein [Massilia sp. 9096]
MKTTLAAIAFFVTCAPAFAQSAAPLPSADPQVVAATRQMLATMKVRDTMAATMRQIEMQMPAQVKSSATMTIKNNPKLNEQQKDEALRKLDQDLPKISAQMHTVLGDPTLIDEMITEMVPLYAETFTLDEIRQLTAFYASPVGQKTLEVMPALMGRGMEIGNRIMMPRMQKIMTQNAHVAAGQ